MESAAVRSVDRAASLLIALGEFDGEAGVTELARRLGLLKSTASRLLSTLHARGQVIAAVEVWGPASRVSPVRLPQLAVEARNTATAISVRLGGVTA